VEVLEAAGFEVKILKNRKCCGRPMISKGMLKEARRYAAHNVNLLFPYVKRGIPIVGIEPSCVAAFRDEYIDLLKNDAAEQVANNFFFIEEFLTNLAEQGKLHLPWGDSLKPRQPLPSKSDWRHPKYAKNAAADSECLNRGNQQRMLRYGRRVWLRAGAL